MLSRKRAVVFALILVVCSLTFATLSVKLYLPDGAPYDLSGWRSKPVDPASSLLPEVNETVMALPPKDYTITDADGICSRFSPVYFEDFQAHRASYCNPDSSAKLTCFHRLSEFNGKTDSFCYAQGAVLDVQQKKFHLNCALRQFSEQEENDGLLPFDRLPSYWYETGPASIFSAAIDVRASVISPAVARVGDGFEEEKGSPQDTPQPIEDDPVPSVAPPKTLLLLKREGEGNPWHSLMEIFSTYMTFDILRMPTGISKNQAPLFSDPSDSDDTQVVILDDRGDGPYFDLWTLYARRRPLRLSELLVDQATVENLASVNLVVPLAGSSNPFWQDDAHAEQCTNSPTLNVFSRRVLDFYGVQGPPLRTQEKPLMVTFVWRREHRRLKNENFLLAKLSRMNPHISVQMVDFAAHSFSEQVRVAQESDVLVGIHGAGLTHSIFMRQGASAVVEIQPEGLDHHGFRNVAGMRGLGYFRTHAKIIPPESWSAGELTAAVDGMQKVDRTYNDTEQATRQDSNRIITGKRRQKIERREKWHFNDIEIEEGRFFEVVEAAIKFMYNKGPWSFDMK
ncbi:hypothetical protein F4801DRAFT_592828 [Xylaria longipes]|nr:hypothetical protein F4801DRAFT_592828 [Xylaria longipes]RYC57544.1 hypothetical protein CHU98_g8663 [Xylaria longipes]